MKAVMKISVMLTLIFSVYSQPTMAREFADIYTDCGIGAMIAPTNDAVAAVTNVTWDSGTTAISTNVSSDESCSGGQEKTAAYIHDAYEQIESDLAAGTGKYLDTLAAVAGCNVSKRSKIISQFRSDFVENVKSVDYSAQSRFDRSKGMFDTFTKRIHQEFAGSCNIG